MNSIRGSLPVKHFRLPPHDAPDSDEREHLLLKGNDISWRRSLQQTWPIFLVALLSWFGAMAFERSSAAGLRYLPWIMSFIALVSLVLREISRHRFEARVRGLRLVITSGVFRFQRLSTGLVHFNAHYLIQHQSDALFGLYRIRIMGGSRKGHPYLELTGLSHANALRVYEAFKFYVDRQVSINPKVVEQEKNLHSAYP